MGLSETKEEIERIAKDKGIKVLVSSEWDKEAKPLLNVKNKETEVDDYKKFLDIAEELGCSFIMMNVGQIYEDYIYDGYDPEKDPESIKEKLKEIETRYNHLIGEYMIIQLVLSVQNIKYECELYNEDEEIPHIEGELIEASEQIEEKRNETIKCKRCGEDTGIKSFSDSSPQREVYCPDCQQKLGEEKEKELDDFSEKLSKDEGFRKLKNNEMRKIYINKYYPRISSEDIPKIATKVRARLELEKMGY